MIYDVDSPSSPEDTNSLNSSLNFIFLVPLSLFLQAKAPPSSPLSLQVQCWSFSHMSNLHLSCLFITTRRIATQNIWSPVLPSLRSSRVLFPHVSPREDLVLSEQQQLASLTAGFGSSCGVERIPTPPPLSLISSCNLTRQQTRRLLSNDSQSVKTLINPANNLLWILC